MLWVHWARVSTEIRYGGMHQRKTVNGCNDP